VNVEPPPIDGDLESLHEEAGAEIEEETGAVLSYGNDEQALEAIAHGLVVFDRSTSPRLRVNGAGRYEVLQPFCSEPLAELSPGFGCDAVLVLPDKTEVAARVLVCDHVYVLLFEPEDAPAAAKVLQALNKASKSVKDSSVRDIGASTALFALVGPGSKMALRGMGAQEKLATDGAGFHMFFLFGMPPQPVIVIAGVAFGCELQGVLLLVDEAVAGSLWAAITGHLNALPAGQRVWEEAIGVIAEVPNPVSNPVSREEEQDIDSLVAE
jgi:glycine cleavage system aminomethyltransferase T